MQKPEPLYFGEVKEISVGEFFPDRRSLHHARVHLATQAGIHGRAHEGADSIVISGGYEDDQDHGERIIYTGEGGRDPSTGKQVRDQALTRGNHALVVSHLRRLPVRVIRGYQKDNAYSPELGYRYDGLYQVRSYWHDQGVSGFLVWRFELIREDPTPPSWSISLVHDSGAPTNRRESYRSEIIRDPMVSDRVKRLYDYRCQVCGQRLETPGGPYAEGAHIRPLGSPHHGPDHEENLLCLCPNDHVLFDTGAWSIAPDFKLLGQKVGMLALHKDHKLSEVCLAYHREHIWISPAQLKNPADA